MKKIILIIILFCQFSMYSQFAIGKDYKTCVKELKIFLSKNGFNEYNQEKIYPNDIHKETFYVKQLFKEEIEINYFTNKFGNVTQISINPTTQENLEKLIKIFKLKTWETKTVEYSSKLYKQYIKENIVVEINPDNYLNISKK